MLALIKEEIADIQNQGFDNDILNEDFFYYLLLKEKEFIQSYLSKYKIRKFICDIRLFNRILEDFQSLDFNCLQLLYNHLLKFKSIFDIYELFSVLFKKIENIFNDKNIKTNYYLINELNNIYSIMDSNVYYINTHFDKLYSTLKVQSQEIKEIKIKMNHLRNEMDKLKKKTDFQEKKIQKICQLLNCTISFEPIRFPMITKNRYTYDDKNIRNWIKMKHNDHMNIQPL